MDIHETTDAIVQLSKPYGFIIIDEAVHMWVSLTNLSDKELKSPKSDKS